MHFGTGKSRDVLCRACLTATRSSRQARQARLARHVFRGVATAWYGVDMSTSLFPEIVPEIDANTEHKRLNLYTRALLFLRRPSYWNKHGATRTTRHDTPCVTCRDVTPQVEIGLIHTGLLQRQRFDADTDDDHWRSDTSAGADSGRGSWHETGT